jgi:hypothetical protein
VVQINEQVPQHRYNFSLPSMCQLLDTPSHQKIKIIPMFQRNLLLLASGFKGACPSRRKY